MSNNVTADNKYYASRKPLELSQLAEGSSLKRNNFSYQAQMGVGGRSSDVYYASPDQYQEPNVKASKPELIAMLELGPDVAVLEQIIDAYSRGMTSMSISGNQEEINAARVAVDLAVGRNTLTREQADGLSWVTTVSVPAQPLPTEEFSPAAVGEVVESQPQQVQEQPEIEKQEEPTQDEETEEAAQDDSDD
jgi:hypothetical protein